MKKLILTLIFIFTLSLNINSQVVNDETTLTTFVTPNKPYTLYDYWCKYAEIYDDFLSNKTIYKLSKEMLIIDKDYNYYTNSYNNTQDGAYLSIINKLFTDRENKCLEIIYRYQQICETKYSNHKHNESIKEIRNGQCKYQYLLERSLSIKSDLTSYYSSSNIKSINNYLKSK